MRCCTQPERIASGGAHPGRKTQGLRSASSSAQGGTAVRTIRASQALAAGFVITRLSESAAGAAIYQQGIFSLGVQASPEVARCGIRGGRGQRLLAIVGGFNLCVLKSRARRGIGARS